jgi:glutamine synthetase
VKAIFGLANRSAAIRIPKYANTEATKRFEFRPPDATCNIYLAIAALLMAGIDGVQKKIDPMKEGFGPYDINVFQLPKAKLSKIKSLPTSLKEALDALSKDHKFLLAGNIFSEQLIESWIEHKLNKEFNELRARPHPYEISLYYDL